MGKLSMFVVPNGYILDIQGPYFSNAANNDATILISGFRRYLIAYFLKPFDILIVHRGYRDAVQYLQRLGMVLKMPNTLWPDQIEFTTEEDS